MHGGTEKPAYGAATWVIDWPMEDRHEVQMGRRLTIIRGLTRTWVVLSVLWIGVIVAIALYDRPLPTPDNYYRPAECDTLSDSECQKVLSAEGKNVFDAYDPVRPVASEPEARNKIIRVASIALIPPVTLLLLGFILVWIGRGFWKPPTGT